MQYLPARANDNILALFAAAKWGKGWRATVFPPQLEQTWSPCAAGRVPCIDKARRVALTVVAANVPLFLLLLTLMLSLLGVV